MLCRRAIARVRFRPWKRQWNKLTVPKFLSDAKLLPQERFEHPNLCLPPDDITLAIAERLWSGLLGKACAGLNSKHRASGTEALSELRSGSVSDRVREAMRWAGSGMQEDVFLAMIGSSSISTASAATRTPAHSIAPANCPEIWLPSQGRICAKAPTGAGKSTLGTLCRSKPLIQPKKIMRSFSAYPSTVAPCEANSRKPRAVKASANAGFC